jgi:hypothetical protein
MLESKSIVRKDFNERAQHNILKDPPALFVPCPHINGKMVKKVVPFKNTTLFQKNIPTEEIARHN